MKAAIFKQANIKNISCIAIYVYIGLIYCQTNLLNACNMLIRKLKLMIKFMNK